MIVESQRLTRHFGVTVQLTFPLVGMLSALLLPTMHVLSRPISTNTLPDIESELVQIHALSVNQLAKLDISELNLWCAEGLPGASRLGSKACLSQLDAWASRVRTETERHQYRFKRNPAEFGNSEGFFRMLMLAVVLAEDCGVQYHPGKRSDPAAAKVRDGFFADSRDVFLHGLLGPERRGTCSSLPVLYVAVGRRLGYPLKLVTTKGHLFVRWEGKGERFNVEAAGNGLNRFDDDYYRRWPYPVSDKEVASEGYLQSLTPSGELAVFLSIRGLCLREAGRTTEAAEAFASASRLAPECQGYKVLERSSRKLHGETNTINLQSEIQNKKQMP